MTDPYIYSNGTLINKFNEKDYIKLNQIESDLCFIKLMGIDSLEVNKIDENLIKTIHKYIFDDIFDWAGEYRIVPIYKSELVIPGCCVPYSHYKNIEYDLNQRINSLDNTNWDHYDINELSFIFARQIALLWRVHPFRDGNTRSIISFAYIYAKKMGFPFVLDNFINQLNRQYDANGNIKKFSIRDKFVLACLNDKDYPEVEPLAKEYKKSLTYKNKRY